MITKNEVYVLSKKDINDLGYYRAVRLEEDNIFNSKGELISELVIYFTIFDLELAIELRNYLHEFRVSQEIQYILQPIHLFVPSEEVNKPIPFLKRSSTKLWINREVLYGSNYLRDFLCITNNQLVKLTMLSTELNKDLVLDILSTAKQFFEMRKIKIFSNTGFELSYDIRRLSEFFNNKENTLNSADDFLFK